MCCLKYPGFWLGLLIGRHLLTNPTACILISFNDGISNKSEQPHKSGVIPGCFLACNLITLPPSLLTITSVIWTTHNAPSSLSPVEGFSCGFMASLGELIIQ